MTASDAPAWQPSALQRDRDTYRRARARRSGLLATVSTAVVVVLVVLTVGRSTGWDRVSASFFNFRVGWHDLPALLRALWINVQIMLVAEACVLVIGAVLAALRTLQGPVFFPLRLFATVYVDLFRGVPVLIVLYLVGFGVPGLQLQFTPTSPFVLCTIALVLSYTAYVAEVFRAGIESVHPSQRAAARSLGLTHLQSLRYVIFPQAVRRVMPPLLNDFVSLQKDTSLVSTVGVIEVVLRAANQQSKNFLFVSYVMAALLFLAMTVPLTRLTDYVARRQGWFGAGGGAV